jgi:amidase
MFRISTSLTSTVLASLLLFTIIDHTYAAEEQLPIWQDYDESSDLELAAQHSDESMRFQVLNSKVRDKNELWQGFNQQLENFSAELYQSLKPLILDRSVSQIQRAVAEGRLSYEQLTSFYIYRIRDIESDNDKYLNAVISLNPDAINRARELDALRASDQFDSANPMFGIPVLLKDNIGFSELPTTAGAVALQENYTENSFVAQRLLDNAAIILGKANLSEWAYFFCNDCPSGWSALGGQTLNPYGRFAHGTGGSSSGSGAATAANYATVAVGSETSGSILSPASSNSLVGLKPTTGTLSRTGVVPISATLDTAGPITRTVEEAVFLFNAMAGYDENDMAMPMLSDDLSLEYRLSDLNGIRAGVISDFENDSHYQQAVSLLSQNGVSVFAVDFSSPDFEDFLNLLGGEMVRDLALYLSQHAASTVEITSIDDLQQFNQQDLESRAPYGQDLVDMMADLNLPSARLQEIGDQLQSSARDFLEGIFSESNLQVLLSVNASNAGVAALANYPALTVPMGYTEEGDPVGLTFIAPSFEEQVLVDIAAQFERLSNARRIPAQYQ